MAITPGQIAVTPGSGKILDTAELTVSSTVVEREIVCIASPSTAANYAEVTSGNALLVDSSATTQPVSGTVTASQATAANLKAEAVLLDGAGTNLGTIKAASTQSATTDTSLIVQINPEQPALTTALNVHDAAPASQAVTNAGTFAVQAAQATAANLNATVVGPTITKGTQGAAGFSVQDLKDAGRNTSTLFMAAAVAGTTAEVMQSLTGYKSGAAVTATTTPAVVTSGKTYRVTSISISYQQLSTTGVAAMFRLRANLTGVGVVGSPLVMNLVIGSPAAVAGAYSSEEFLFPEGLEFAAGTGLAVGLIGLSAAGVAGTASGFAQITIVGYEY